MTSTRHDLREVLDLTRRQHGLKARIDVLRSRLDTALRDEWQRTGAAPTWKVRGMGQLRLDGADTEPKALVVDAVAYADYIAQHYPTEAVATITLAPAQLEAALEALKFAEVDVDLATVAARPAYQSRHLAELRIEHELVPDGDTVKNEWTVTEIDEETGESRPVPGVTGYFPPATMKVVVDPAAKSDAVAAALAEQEELDKELANAEVVDLTTAENRTPYVGEGADGARRSAQIDREEADTLDPGEARDSRLASADRWDEQAAQQDPATVPASDTTTEGA